MLKHVVCFYVKHDRTKNQTISTKNITEQGCHPVQKPETITQLPRTWSDSPTKWLSHEAAGCLSFKSLMFTEWSQNHLASVVSKRSDTVNQQFHIIIYIVIYIYIIYMYIYVHPFPGCPLFPPISLARIRDIKENKQFGDVLDVHRMHFGGINWSIPGLCTCCSTRATRATSMLPWSDFEAGLNISVTMQMWNGSTGDSWYSRVELRLVWVPTLCLKLLSPLTCDKHS